MSAPVVSGRFMVPVELDGRLTQAQRDTTGARTAFGVVKSQPRRRQP